MWNPVDSILVCYNNWEMLNVILFEFLTRIIRLNSFCPRKITFIGIRFISVLYTYSLQLWSFPFEFSAFWIFNLLILLSYDIHKNPGPLDNDHDFSTGFFSFCNWNLNTLSKDNFNRISNLQAHNSIFKYDIISM